MSNVRWAPVALLAVALSACAHTSTSPANQTLPAAEAHAETSASAPAATSSRFSWAVAGDRYEQPHYIVVAGDDVISGPVLANGERCDPWDDQSTRLCYPPELATRSTP